MAGQDDVSRSYDAVAAEYARQIAGELAHKPWDRALLDRFAGSVRPGGVVADVGCGPGHVGRYVFERGVRVVGVDVSAQMIELARDLNPSMEFIRADMRVIDVPDQSWAGIVAFYSLIHIARNEMVATLRELKRVLEPGAPLLLAFHIGEQTIHLDEWWERDVSVDFFFYRPDEMRGWLEEAGFGIDEVLEREPYAPEVEHQSRRCYVFARRA